VSARSYIITLLWISQLASSFFGCIDVKFEKCIYSSISDIFSHRKEILIASASWRIGDEVLRDMKSTVENKFPKTLVKIFLVEHGRKYIP
jgi:hypothetical protein